jgi:hypothetical protein
VLWTVVHDHSGESEVDSRREENWGNRETDDLTSFYQHSFRRIAGREYSEFRLYIRTIARLNVRKQGGTYMRNGVWLNMLCFILTRAR